MENKERRNAIKQLNASNADPCPLRHARLGERRKLTVALVGIQAGEAACCCWAGRALSKLRSAGERILPQRRGALSLPLPVTTTTAHNIATGYCSIIQAEDACKRTG